MADLKKQDGPDLSMGLPHSFYWILVDDGSTLSSGDTDISLKLFMPIGDGPTFGKVHVSSSVPKVDGRISSGKPERG